MNKNYELALSRIEIVSKKNSTYLDLSMLQLDFIPKEVFQLKSLAVLNLEDNSIKEVPTGIGLLTNLEVLNLNNNKLTLIPNSIGSLNKLTGLYLNNNNIRNLPESIILLKNLNILDLDHNNLLQLPDMISELKYLKGLYLNDNQLSKLPRNIGRLFELTELDVANNKLNTFPVSSKKLINLTSLNIYNNPIQLGAEIYSLKPIEQVNQILKLQNAKKKGTLEPINEAKVIFIGESHYGKTHLIEFIKNGTIKRNISTTHGIERNSIIIPNKSKNIRLNIWDLGGQEFMRSTHQFFFSERTLYVLVTLARRERKELNHWLKLANQLGNKAPVLIVINKIDIDDHDLDRKSLQRDYPNILGFVRTCIHDCAEITAVNALENLKKQIINIVSDKELMPSVHEKRSPEWFKVKDELEKLEEEGTDYITYKEYESLNFIKDLPDGERKMNLKLLNMLGAVVSFVDDPRLIDTNVINPQWIMDGVYAIINDSIVKDENKGRLHINDLERILPSDEFPKSRHSYLLELMKKFNLCYEAKDFKNTYYLPDLFEDIEPEFNWKDEDLMYFRYNYDDFSPDTFITKFIVEMHQDIIDEKRWRSGVYISNESCQAKVYQSYRKNYINIEIKGLNQERRSYLYSIREVFRKLHKPFNNMQIMEEVKYKEHWVNYNRLVKFEERNRAYYHDELDEDIPVTDILNGYTSFYERSGNLKKIKIFLASSEELKQDREQFELFINRENNKLVDKGIYLKLEIWEDFIDAMSQTRLQDEYNIAVKNCDIFVSLFFTKVGKFTEEEFENAFSEFKENGRPLVYTYFKDSEISTGNLNSSIRSLLDFQEKLKELGHFRTQYNNIEDLKFQFRNQLDKIIDKF